MRIVCALVVALLIAPATAHAAAWPATFNAPASLDSESSSDIVTADLNGDLLPDFVLAQETANKVAVVLSKGLGSYAGRVTYTVNTADSGALPIAEAVGDFNNDGRPDILIASRTSGSKYVSVLTSNANGTLTSTTTAQIFQTGIEDVAVGHFLGDGNLDAVITTGDGHFVFLVGDGTGHFTNGATTSQYTGNTKGIAVADLNGDNKDDLVITSYSGSPAFGEWVSVLLSQPAGGYTTDSYTTGAGSRDVAIGDINGDGHPDLAVANEEDHTISVLLAKSSPIGAFNGATNYSAGTDNSGEMRSIKIGDLNGDGYGDVVVTRGGGNAPNVSDNDRGVAVFDGTASGALTAPTLLGGNGTTGVVLTDIDNVFGPDIATAVLNGSTSYGLTLRSNNTGRSSATAPANGSTRAETINYTTAGLAAAKIRLYVKTPGAGAFTQLAEQANPGKTGTFNITLAAGDGRYDFYTTLVDAAGDEELAPTTPDATTQVALTRSLTYAAPAFAAQPLTTSSDPAIAKIVNDGEAPLTVRSPTITGTNLADFAIVGDECSGTTLAPGGSCNLQIRFTPSALGARSARVVYTTESISGAIPLNAEGAPAPVVVQQTPTPAPTPQPLPKAPAKIVAAVSFGYKHATKKSTQLTSLTVKGFPKGATIIAKLGKKTFTKKNASGTVSLKSLIAKPLKVGTKITVTISKPGMTSATKTLTIRAHKAPVISSR